MTGAGAPLRRALSRSVGWLADRRIPTRLRAPAFRAYARATGADLSEARPPLEAYASLGAFFVRRLVDGARPFPDDPDLLPSPVDGRVQHVGLVNRETLLQAKGSPYSVRGLLAGVAADVDWDGAAAWTLYLSPRDYHRIHAPEDARLTEIRWVPGDRRSVHPRVLGRRPGLFAGNERAVLRLCSGRGDFALVLVGALNVGRIRVVGVSRETEGRLENGPRFARGAELARFEMGSTVVLLWPAGGARPLPELDFGGAVRLGQPIGTHAPARATSAAP